MAPTQATLPISEISTYHRSFTIKARVTSKSDMRTFSKGPSEGKVFSVDLLDAEGGEIRASFFQPAADKFFTMLEKGKCFTFSKGNIKVANKQFNNTKHRYELVFDDKAVVEVAENDANIDSIKVNIMDLRTVQSMQNQMSKEGKPCSADLCGVITSAKPFVAFTSKEGKELVKRDLTIADDSAITIDVTLWGDRAKTDDSSFENNPVVCMKGVSVKEWQGGLQGSLSGSGALIFGIDRPEAAKVHKWWTEGGSSQTLTALSAAAGSAPARQGRPADLAQLRNAAEEGKFSEQAEIFTTVCRVALVQMQKQGETQPLYYDACQEMRQGNFGKELPCNKRVDQSGFCPTCNCVGKSAPRYNLRCKYADYGESLWMTTFHEGSCQVAGMTAEDAKAMEKGEGGREALEAAVRHNYFLEPLQLTIRAKMETYQGEVRANTGCVDARRVAYPQHGRAMLKNISEMLVEDPSNL